MQTNSTGLAQLLSGQSIQTSQVGAATPTQSAVPATTDAAPAAGTIAPELQESEASGFASLVFGPTDAATTEPTHVECTVCQFHDQNTQQLTHTVANDSITPVVVPAVTPSVKISALTSNVQPSGNESDLLTPPLATSPDAAKTQFENAPEPEQHTVDANSDLQVHLSNEDVGIEDNFEVEQSIEATDVVTAVPVAIVSPPVPTSDFAAVIQSQISEQPTEPVLSTNPIAASDTNQPPVSIVDTENPNKLPNERQPTRDQQPEAPSEYRALPVRSPKAINPHKSGNTFGTDKTPSESNPQLPVQHRPNVPRPIDSRRPAAAEPRLSDTRFPSNTDDSAGFDRPRLQTSSTRPQLQPNTLFEPPGSPKPIPANVGSTDSVPPAELDQPAIESLDAPVLSTTPNNVAEAVPTEALTTETPPSVEVTPAAQVSSPQAEPAPTDTPSVIDSVQTPLTSDPGIAPEATTNKQADTVPALTTEPQGVPITATPVDGSEQAIDLPNVVAQAESAPKPRVKRPENRDRVDSISDQPDNTTAATESASSTSVVNSIAETTDTLDSTADQPEVDSIQPRERRASFAEPGLQISDAEVVEGGDLPEQEVLIAEANDRLKPLATASAIPAATAAIATAAVADEFEPTVSTVDTVAEVPTSPVPTFGNAVEEPDPLQPKFTDTVAESKQVPFESLVEDTHDTILSHAKLLRVDETTELEIEITPPELGRLNIKVSRTDSEFSARISIVEPGTLELLQAELFELRDSLAESGISVGSFDVEQQSRDQTGSNDRSKSNPHRQQSGQGDASTDDSSRRPPPRPPADDNQSIDIRV